MSRGPSSIGTEGLYLGQFEYTVDKQRRLAIPSQWRSDDPHQNCFFLLPGRLHALQLVPASMFREFLEKLKKVSFADSKAMVALGKIGSMAQQCVCDKQGRISLSQNLMQHAGITDKALLLGAVATIQIWQPEAWHEQQIDSETGLDVIQSIQEKGDDFADILRHMTAG